MRSALLAGLVLIGLGAGPARAEVRRLEVEVPVAAAAARAGSPARRAALDAALTEAVARVARELVEGDAAAGIGPDADWAGILGGAPDEFTVRYRVLDELAAPGGRAGGDPEVAPASLLRVEVHVDAARVAQRLRDGGWPVAEPRQPLGEAFRLEVHGVPSYRAYAALLAHLQGRSGAGAATPELFEPGRAVLRVRAAGGPHALLRRLLAAPPEGMRVEVLGWNEGGLALRVLEWVDEESPPAGPGPPDD